MRILVTGAAGFLGSHLSRYLLNKGHTVVGLDNFISGNIDNIQDLFKDRKFEFIKYDVTNFLHVPGRLDAVLHFASPASPIDYLKFPIPTLKVGALGTHKALGLAKDKKAIFMIASTSEVYGDPLLSPQHEGYWGNVNPVGPRGVYDEAKRFAEAIGYEPPGIFLFPVVIRGKVIGLVYADNPMASINEEEVRSLLAAAEQAYERIILSSRKK